MTTPNPVLRKDINSRSVHHHNACSPSAQDAYNLSMSTIHLIKRFVLPVVLLLIMPLPGNAAGMLNFPDDAVINITHEPYNAIPNDGVDDTDTIQRAITDNLGTGRFIYFPAGVYDISRPLVAKDKSGKFNARLVLVGQSRQLTILKLADHCPDFADPQNPRAIITTGSVQQQGDSPDGGGNKAFGNDIMNMTLNTGRQNPGAIAISYAVSNWGAIQQVIIKSGDGKGVAGIAATRKIPGPGLIRHVRIDDFDVGIDIADCQYGFTMEKLTLANQHIAAIRTDMNVLHVNELHSFNTVPAVKITHRQGMLTMLDSTLMNLKPKGTAIESKGTVLLSNVIKPAGYDKLIKNSPRHLINPTMLLNGRDAPVFFENDLTQWMPIGPRKTGESDDTQAIQRAIDSGKPVIYFPNNRQYFISDTIVIRNNVRHLIAMGSEISLGAAKEPFSDITNPRPVFRIDPTGHDQLLIEHIFFNCQYPGEVLFENNSPATLTIRHCGGWVGADGHRHAYRNTANATGTVFVEDVFLPGWTFKNQTVYARQFNPENPDGDGIEPQVLNDGSKLWILGFKTEGPAPFIKTINRGITQLLGGYNYISATHKPSVPANSVPYIIDHAQASISVVTENFRDNDYKVYIKANGKDITHADLPPRNGHQGDRSLSILNVTTSP